MVLEILQSNIQQNLLALQETNCTYSWKSCTGCDISNCKLSVGDLLSSTNDANAKLGLQSIQVKELQWGKDHTKFPHFDIILGADIVYLEETFPALIQTLEHVSGCETLILLSCKIRYQRDQRFLRILKKKFHIEQVQYIEDTQIKLFKAKLKSCNNHNKVLT